MELDEKSCEFALLVNSYDQKVYRKRVEQSCFGLKGNRRRSAEYETPHQTERPRHDNDNALSSSRCI